MPTGTWELELTHPAWLLGLPVVIPVLLYFFWYSLTDYAWWQRTTSLVVRCGLLLLVLLSLAGLTALQPTTEQYVIFAIDNSLSVGDASGPINTFLDEALKAKGNNAVAYIPFAAGPGRLTQVRPKIVPAELRPAIDLPPEALGKSANATVATGTGDAKQPDANGAATADKSTADGKSPTTSGTTNAGASSTDGPPSNLGLNPEGSDLAAVIAAAAGSMPPTHAPHVVVFSDGNATSGEVLQAALRAGFPVSTVPLPTRPDPEVQVSSVNVPAQVRDGEPFYVEVLVDSNHADEGLIEVFRGAHKVLSERQTIKAGENRFRFRQSVTGERLAEFVVRISGLSQDTLLDNNSESGLVYTAGKPRVLLVDPDPRQLDDLARALEQEDIQVHVRPPTGMPDNLADLQNYEMLVLSNVPATKLTQRQMEVARTYVQDLGGGFLMLGGDQSFGLGGYYKSVLEEILPVRSDFEKEKEKPSLAMTLVIDRSGSMSGEKLEMAKTAAQAAVELLGPSDKICVIAFDGDPFTVVEMQQLTDKSRVIDEIARIDEGGGTSMYPPMVEAHEGLVATVAKLKHIIILTDGVSEPGDFAGITQEMANAKITVTTVAIGAGCDEELLQEIAKIGNGRYYFADDPASIPQIFAKETVTASKSAIDEQPFVPQLVRATRVLADIDFESAPFLLGYVMTRPKPTCELILASEKGDPVLAWWRYGLGMTAAFTSDAKARWSAEWLGWPEFSRFWAQTIRHVMRKSESKGLLVQVQKRAGKALVTVDSVDPIGQFINEAITETTVIDPQLGSRKVSLLQTAPGRYAGEFATPTSGSYHMELQQTLAGQPVVQQSRGITVGYSDELRLKPTNEALLQSVASVTGGRFNPLPGSVFENTSRTAQRPTPLWPWLIAAAAILLVLDVALRRIDMTVYGFGKPTGEYFGIAVPRAQG